MNILKSFGRLFGGGPRSAPGGDGGIYFYVRGHRCKEVIRVRLNPMNDLSKRDDENGRESANFYARKTIVGRECFDRMEAEFVFDAGKHLTYKEVMGGVFVDEAAYQAWLDSKTAGE